MNNFAIIYIFHFRVPVPTLPTSTLERFSVDPGTTLDCTQSPDPSNLPEFLEWTNICDHTQYCALLNSYVKPENYKCLENSILELWPSNQDFSALTESDILNKINEDPLVGNFGTINIDTYITPIRNESGYIIGAESLSLSLFGQSNTSLITEEDLSNAEDGVPVST